MTEDEAKTKWCPHAMPVQIAHNKCVSPAGRDHKTNDGVLTEVAQNCIASHCMMWRWYRTHINDGAGGPMTVSTDTHGFCGLAGHWFEDRRT